MEVDLDELHDRIMQPARDYVALCRKDDPAVCDESVIRIARMQADLVVQRRVIKDLRAENARLRDEIVKGTR